MSLFNETVWEQMEARNQEWMNDPTGPSVRTKTEEAIRKSVYSNDRFKE